MAMDDKPRCGWSGGGRADELMIAYHDEEWGVPVHNDQKQFEFLTLESAQAGLSWSTVLRKRKSKYPPAEPEALGGEPLEAVC
jgi:DNA-3-methyladenine glycosylase I